MSLAVIFVMVLATIVTWPIQELLLNRFGIGYLQTIIFILVIAALVQLVELITKKYMVSLYQSLGIYLPLITTNCAVLGVTVSNIDNNFTYIESIVNSVGAGLGFLIAMVLFSGVRMDMENNNVPEVLKGVPITLIAAAILSVSFTGFSGVVDGIFG